MSSGVPSRQRALPTLGGTSEYLGRGWGQGWKPRPGFSEFSREGLERPARRQGARYNHPVRVVGTGEKGNGPSGMSPSGSVSWDDRAVREEVGGQTGVNPHFQDTPPEGCARGSDGRSPAGRPSGERLGAGVHGTASCTRGPARATPVRPRLAPGGRHLL